MESMQSEIVSLQRDDERSNANLSGKCQLKERAKNMNNFWTMQHRMNGGKNTGA